MQTLCPPLVMGAMLWVFCLRLYTTHQRGQVQLCRLNSKPRKFPNLCRESQEFPNGLLSKYRVISNFELGAGAANKVIDARIASIFNYFQTSSKQIPVARSCKNNFHWLRGQLEAERLSGLSSCPSPFLPAF